MPDLIEVELILQPVLRPRVLVPPATLPADMAQVIVGPAGPPGGGTYTHTQGIAASVWTVPHNLSRRPSVSVTDHLGNLVHADVRYLDSNLVQITHGSALSGFAYCN